MTFDQLRYFMCVAREGHLGKAARILHVTASTLSHAVKGLEDSLGVELFDRQGRGIVLTTAGRRLLEEAAPIMTAMEGLPRKLASGRKDSVMVSCGGPPSLISSLLIPAVGRLEGHFSQFDFKFSYVPSSDVERQIGEGKLHFGIKFMEEKHLKVNQQLILKDTGFACARHQHPLLQLPPGERVQHLHEFPLVSPQPMEVISASGTAAFNKVLSRLCRLHYVIPSYLDGVNLMKERDYWSLFPGWVIRRYRDDIARISDEDLTMNVQIVAVQGPQNPLGDLANDLIDALRMASRS